MTTITIAQINTEMAAAVTSMKNGDYAAAYTSALAAQALLAVKPDTSFSDEQLEFDREAIDKFVDRMEKLSRSAKVSSSITQIPVRRQCSIQNVSDCE